MLRNCMRDLVALSGMPAWWIGRSPRDIAESLRDLLASMLRADAVHVQLRDSETGDQRLAVHSMPGGAATAPEGDSGGAKDNVLLGVANDALRLATFPIGIDAELGRFTVCSRRPEFPDEGEVLLMQVAASHVAVALQHAVLLVRHEQAERLLSVQAAQQAAVVRLGMHALSGIVLNEMLADAATTVADMLHVEHSAILELSGDGTSFLLRAGVGWRPGLVGSMRVAARADSEPGYALLATEPVIVQNLATETRFGRPAFLQEHGVASGLTVVIHAPGGPFGVLGAHGRDVREFTRDDVYFLQSVANLLAAAIERDRAESEREELLVRTAAAQAEAEKASRTKSEFLGVMSHELRTPLNAIGGYAQLLELGIQGPVSDAQKETLGRIQRSQRYLLGLINNVLSFLKLGSGRVHYEISDVDLEELLNAIDEMMRPLMLAKNLNYELRLTCGLNVRADRDKLQQILINLLSNATKFTDPGGTVRVECATVADMVRIRVEDTGWGIPRDRLASVFEPFVQVEQTKGRSAEGTGLGLAICRDLASGMGGGIRVESEVGVGTAFTVELPRGALETRHAEDEFAAVS